MARVPGAPGDNTFLVVQRRQALPGLRPGAVQGPECSSLGNAQALGSRCPRLLLAVTCSELGVVFCFSLYLNSV